MNHSSLALILALGICPGMPAQSIVVPAALATSDGASSGALAGVSFRGRQQVLIDASLLGGASSHNLDALWFRRDAGHRDSLAAGTAGWSIRIGETTVAPTRAQRGFQSNFETNVTTCFQGTVSLPASPAPGADPWAIDQTLRIPFTVPVPYSGGHLCIELESTSALVMSSRWPVDCASESLDGAALPIGIHCSALAEIPAQYALTTNANLLAIGATVRFAVMGRFGTPAALVIGQELNGGIDLDGIGMTGCRLYVQSSAVLNSILTDRPNVVPAWEAAGCTFEFAIPFSSSLLSGTFAAQSVNLETGSQTSNPLGVTLSQGLRCTLASSPPTLGMAMVDCPPIDLPAPLPTEGIVINNRAPVLKLFYH